MFADLSRINADLAILVLSVLVGFYQPVGPDLFIILKGLSGSEPYSAAILAIASTTVGAGLAYLAARIWGRKILLRFFGKKADAIKKAEALYRRYGAWFVFASAIGPMPLKYAIWISGLSGMPSRKFFFLLAAGLVPRFLAEAMIARYCPDFLRSVMERCNWAFH